MEGYEFLSQEALKIYLTNMTKKITAKEERQVKQRQKEKIGNKRRRLINWRIFAKSSNVIPFE
jgi:hypothetical protein